MLLNISSNGGGELACRAVIKVGGFGCAFSFSHDQKPGELGGRDRPAGEVEPK
jgi:hypothetical protein